MKMSEMTENRYGILDIAKGTTDPGIDCFNQYAIYANSAYSAYFKVRLSILVSKGPFIQISKGR